MFCKLFLTGTTDIINVVDIPFIEMNLSKPDITFSLERRRYKVINYILPAWPIVFNDKGTIIYQTNNAKSIEELKDHPLIELYITELPTF